MNKKGLYASKDIGEGTKIINYIGKIISKRSEENNKFDNKKKTFIYLI